MRTHLVTIGAASLIALSVAVTVDAQRAGGPRRGGGPPAPEASAPAQAVPDRVPDGRGGAGRGGPAGFAGPRLNLTDDQQKTISAIVRKSRDEVAPLTDELVLARRNLHRELFADSRDNGKVSSLAARVATLEKQILDARVKSDAAIADVLTPEQRQTARTTGPRFRGRGGRGPGGPGFQGGRGPRFQGSAGQRFQGPRFQGPRGRGQ
ncbi:MAG: Spy/CpxP family protein refolding chaperone [Acidobacteria bacterium]|nr:Spy/CpxP family protein refolding chaperone [Acidobacteriota bacterium]